jgi:hypothetical protein
MLPSSDANVGATGERFEAIGEDVDARRSAISASLYWLPDVEPASPDHHPPAAAKENGE